MKILITGANGFLGSHIVEKAISKGHEVTALVREGSDMSNLDHIKGLEVAQVDYSTTASIKESLEKLPVQDVIVHNAGLTKSYTLDKYIRVNVELTDRLIHGIKESKHHSDSLKLAYISSLAAKGPVGNNGPASNYGISKVRAENLIKDSGLNYLIYRPTGIYGKRDVQFVPLIQAAKLGFYPAMTPKFHKMTLINAQDAAENIIECTIQHSNEVIHLEDGHVYHHHDMKSILEKLLNKKTINLRVGRSVVRSILYFSDIVDRKLNRTPKLSREHYSEISQDWDYDFSEERQKIPLTINYSLEDGFREAIAYYKSHNLI